MILFICLFLPAVLAVWLYEHLQKNELSKKQWFYRYCLNTVFINFVCFAVKRFLLGTAAQPFGGGITDATPSEALNYLIMAIPTAVFFSFLQVLFTKHVSLSVEDEHHD